MQAKKLKINDKITAYFLCRERKVSGLFIPPQGQPFVTERDYCGGNCHIEKWEKILGDLGEWQELKALELRMKIYIDEDCKILDSLKWTSQEGEGGEISLSTYDPLIEEVKLYAKKKALSMPSCSASLDSEETKYRYFSHIAYLIGGKLINYDDYELIIISITEDW